MRIYGKDYKKRLESAGVKVNLYDIKSDLSAQDIERYELNREKFYILVKNNRNY